jgi:hypothetical protein
VVSTSKLHIQRHFQILPSRGPEIEIWNSENHNSCLQLFPAAYTGWFTHLLISSQPHLFLYVAVPTPDVCVHIVLCLFLSFPAVYLISTTTKTQNRTINNFQAFQGSIQKFEYFLFSKSLVNLIIEGKREHLQACSPHRP